MSTNASASRFAMADLERITKTLRKKAHSDDTYYYYTCPCGWAAIVLPRYYEDGEIVARAHAAECDGDPPSFTREIKYRNGEFYIEQRGAST